MNEWRETTLGELLRIKHGWAFKSEFFEESSGEGPIVVGIGNFDYSGGFRFESTKIKRYSADYPKEYNLQAGDILLAMTCQTPGGEILGLPGRIPDNNIYLHNQRLGKVEIKKPELLDKSFVYWLFLWQKFNRHLVSTASGTKILHTSPNRIEEFKFNIPPLTLQREIGKTLDSLDAKIDLLRRQNQTLEQITQTLFNHWFVKESQEDWQTKVGKLPIEIIDGDRGNNYPKTSELFDIGDCLFLNAKNVTVNGFNFDQTQFITAEKDALLRSGKLRRNDIVITTRGTVGNIAYYSDLIGYPDVRINSGMIIIRTVSSTVDPIFIFCLMRSAYFKRLIEKQISGSAQPQLPIRDFKQIDVFFPQKEILDRFVALAKPLFNKKFHNDAQIQTLSHLRDTLLPKLMSGQLRVNSE